MNNPVESMPMRTMLTYLLLVLSTAACAVEATAPKTPEEEKALVQEFWQVLMKAEKPELKADAVLMLKGLKGPESRRALAGLLGNTVTGVRRNACQVIAEFDDPEGYFVKPLMGAIYDPEEEVRVAAAAALGRAKLKAPAVKALVTALQKEADKDAADVGWAYHLHKALERLTGHAIEEADNVPNLAKSWSVWWSAHHAEIEKLDEAPDAKTARP
ncbi:MAG: HEAT repeat domain-containing protein [Planctomycetota bacterium]|nr:HEAT repeat domain-containing protein [Planctomycetota bacterium]